MADVPQIERQLYILSLLGENPSGYTIDEIMNNLQRLGIDVSKKTVSRDIDYITENFFVYEEEIVGKTYIKADKLKIDNVSFTIAELLSMYFAREILKPYSNMDVGEKALEIIDKIISQGPEINRAYMEDFSEHFKINSPRGFREKENSEYLRILKRAVEERKSIYMKYYSFNSDTVSDRKFDPYFLEVHEGSYHVVGYCHLRNDIREMRVSRINELELLDETFDKPMDFYESYIQGRFDKLAGNEKIRLVLVFTGEASRFVREYESGKADKITELENGEILFEKETTMTDEIIKWILGFGEEVKVLEPLFIKDRIVEKAQGIWKNYL